MADSFIINGREYFVGDRILYRYINNSHDVGIRVGKILNFFTSLTLIEIETEYEIKLIPYNEVIDKVNVIKQREKGEDNNMDKIKLRMVNSIKDYKFLNDRVFIVTFSDGTTEKAVCDEKDTFDLEKAVEVCVMKKILGGTKAYNDIIKAAMKDIKRIDKQKELEKKREEERAEIIARKRAKRAKQKAIRTERKRQEQINIQAEAFLKAMKDYDELQVEKNYEDFQTEVERLESAKKEDVDILASYKSL